VLAEDAIRTAIMDLKKKRGEALPDLSGGGGHASTEKAMETLRGQMQTASAGRPA